MNFLTVFLLIFTICSIYAFYKILDFFIGKYVSRLELVLFTAVFAFHPTVLSNTINFNLDQGLLTFFLFFLLSYLKERYIFATLFAIFFIFTKEAALFLFPVTLILAFLCYPQKRYIDSIKRASQMIILPVLCFGVYAYYKTQIVGLPLFWQGLGDISQLFLKLFDIFKFDGYLKVQFIQLFVMNFQWILTIIFIPLLLAYLTFFRKNVSKDVKKNIIFCGALLCVLFSLLSRFYPYSNARYLLVLFLIFLLLINQLIAIGINNKYMRIGLNTLFLILFMPSLYQSLDPISNRIFGTFAFGEHKMLKMTSIAGDCCGYGRDQLVYNFQFTQFHYMQNLIYNELKPDQETIILSSHEVWTAALMSQLRRDNYQRTVAKNNIIRPVYETVEGFKKKSISTKEVFYIEYPNVNNHNQIKYLTSFFNNRETLMFQSKGYALKVIKFYN